MSPLSGDRVHQEEAKLCSCHCLWTSSGLKDEPGRRSGGPAGLTEEAAVEPGGGQSQARQGVCLDGHSDRERHSEEGQILDHIDHNYTIGPEMCDIQQSEFLVSDLGSGNCRDL